MKQEKPKAYRSPLWAHLDEIHKWRIAKETWNAIAHKLFVQYGIKVSLQAVQAFYKRATCRDRRGPLGFAPTHSSSRPTRAVINAPKDADSIYEEARRTIREEQHSKPTIVRPGRPL